MDNLSFKEINALMNEVENMGNTAHLYYNPSSGQYVAYGISAFIVSRIVRGLRLRYGNDLQMPVVDVNDKQVGILRQSMQCIMSIEDEYLKFEVDNMYDDQDYDEWAGHIRCQFFGDK